MRADAVRVPAVAGVLLLGALAWLLLGQAAWRSMWNPEGRVDPSPPAVADSDRWSPVDCWFERALPSHCGWLWPTRQDEAGQTRLPVVVLQRAVQPSRRATIYLSGGPGGSSYLGFDAIPHWDEWMQSLELDHDLVLYDPRGAGLSRPSLACAPLQAELRAGLSHDLGSPEARDASWRSYERTLLQCAQQVAPADRAGGLYSTPVHARDLLELIEMVRRQHGYRSVSLYGVSYGSRLAVAAAAADGAGAIERLALDAWYPAGTDLVTREALTFHEIFDDYAGWCAGPVECAAGAESLRAEAATLLATAPLARRTIEVSLEEYGWDTNVTVRLDSAGLASMLLHALGADFDSAQLPQLVSDARRGLWSSAWQDLASDWAATALEEDFSTLALELTECADSGEAVPAQQAAMRRAYPAFAPALQPSELQAGYCERLGVAARPLVPARVERPALVVGHRVDPITPWRAAVGALQQLPQAHWRLLDRPGHGTAGLDDCGSRAVGAWLNAGRLERWNACALLGARDPDSGETGAVSLSVPATD